MAGLPPLYSCIVCNQPIDTGSSLTLRTATVWLKGSGKTVYEVIEERWIYRHEFCRLDQATQDSLF